MITINLDGEDRKMKFMKGTYADNDSLAVEVLVQDEEYGPDVYEPYCSLTVNLELSSLLGNNMAYIDSNDCPGEIIEKLVEDKLIFPTGIIASSGFCNYECYGFSKEFFDQMEKYE